MYGIWIGGPRDKPSRRLNHWSCIWLLHVKNCNTFCTEMVLCTKFNASEQKLASVVQIWIRICFIFQKHWILFDNLLKLETNVHQIKIDSKLNWEPPPFLYWWKETADIAFDSTEDYSGTLQNVGIYEVYLNLRVYTKYIYILQNKEASKQIPTGASSVFTKTLLLTTSISRILNS